MARVLLCALWLAVCLALPPALPEFSLVIDCGSTGSRLHMFQREGSELTASRLGKVKPGISDFVSRPEGAFETLVPLVRLAAARIGQTSVATPLMVRATAGVRALPFESRQAILEAVQRGLSQMQLSVRLAVTVETISGPDEGFYGLVAVNYLHKAVDLALRPLDTKQVGMIDLGGSSTQLALPAPQSDLSKSSVAVHSYVGLGLAVLMKRTRLFKPTTRFKSCLFAEAEHSATPGAPKRCRELLSQLVRPMMRAQHQQSPTPSMDLIAVSGFFHAVHTMTVLLHAMGHNTLAAAWPSPTVQQLQAAVDIFCATPLSTLEDLAKKVEGSDFKRSRCFEANYVIVLLERFNPQQQPVQFADQLQGQSVDWPLGLYLWSSSRYVPDSAVYAFWTIVVVLIVGWLGAMVLLHCTKFNFSRAFRNLSLSSKELQAFL